MFAGEKGERVESFLTQFENITKLTNWSDDHKGLILKTRLKNKAAEFILKNDTTKENDNIDIVKNALIKRFGEIKSLTQAQNEFQNIKQTPVTSIRELEQEIREKTQKFLGDIRESAEMRKINDRIMLAKFLESVREDIKIELKKANIETFEEAVERAVLLEEIFKEEQVNVNTLRLQGTDHEREVLKRDREIAELKQQIQEMQIERSSQINRQPSFQRRQPPVQNKQMQIICQICKRRGHGASTCFYRDTNNKKYENSNKNQGVNAGTVNKKWQGRKNYLN